MIRGATALLAAIVTVFFIYAAAAQANQPTIFPFVSDLGTANSEVNTVQSLCDDLNSAGSGQANCEKQSPFPINTVVGEDSACIDTSPVDFSNVEFDSYLSTASPPYTDYLFWGFVQTCSKPVNIEASINGTWFNFGYIGSNQGTQVIEEICQGQSSLDCTGVDTIDAIRACDTYTGADCNGGSSTGGTSTLTVQRTGNGTVTSSPGGINCGNTCQASFSAGTQVTLTATPASGYAFSGWGGVCSGSSTTCAVTMDANKAVTASFMQSVSQTFVVTPVAGTGGSIAPSTPQQVAQGATTSFTVTPDSGYGINSVTGCGGSLNGNVYTTGPISANCTVTASFKQNAAQTFTVTPVAGAGGSIAPSTPQQVAQGATTSFTVTPDTGYQIAGVTGCAGALSGNIYTTGAITGACTVSASFSQTKTGGTGNPGVITTVAGTGLPGYLGDGGPAIDARLGQVAGLAVDPTGDVYIADPYNSVVRKVNTSGTITTVAGTGVPGYTDDGVLAVDAQLEQPVALGLDAQGGLYIVDLLGAVRYVDPQGIIHTIAGNQFSGPCGSEPPNAVSLYSPSGIAVISPGNMYIANSAANMVCILSPPTYSFSYVGNGTAGFSGDGGSAPYATLYYPTGLALDPAYNLYIADTGNAAIREVKANGDIYTIANQNRFIGYSGDGGSALSAGLTAPTSLAIDSQGNLYVADQGNLRVRRINPQGIITTVVGNGTYGHMADGAPATSGGLDWSTFVNSQSQNFPPVGLATDASGNLYFADGGQVRKVSNPADSSAGFNPNQHGVTGSWYNPATSGQGLEIEVYPNLISSGEGFLFAGWFTFDTTSAGGRRWYTLQGNVSSNSNVANLQIGAAQGGNLDAPPVVAPYVAGQATIDFSDCDHASLDYQFTDGTNRHGSIPLSRLTPNVTCSNSGDNGNAASSYLLSGSWYDPQTSGQGFVFDFSPSINNVFGAWYTYKADGQQTPGTASQDWYTLQSGDFKPGTTSLSNITLVETTGGVFNNPATVSRSQAGVADIVFKSCNEMTLSYHFTSGQNNGRSGTINLRRTGPTPPGCSL